MRIVISSSRFAPEPNIIKGFLSDILEPYHIRVTEDSNEERRNSQEVAYIYFCNDHQANQHVSMQVDEIDHEIKEADWVIAIVPLNHVGKYTTREILLAVDSFYTNAANNPVLTLFNCTDYYSESFPKNRTEEKGYRNGSSQPVFDEEDEISIPHLKQMIEERIASLLQNEEELKEVYLGEYTYDIKGNGLKIAVQEAFKRNYNSFLYRFQQLIGLAQKGSSVIAEQLYFDKQRADFISNEYLPRESVDGSLGQALVNQRKYIIVTGLPGSGKTRAVLQLLNDNNDGNQEKEYAFGALADKDIVVIDKYNISDVYKRLQHEKNIVDYYKRIKNQHKVPYEFFLICDQIKDVFSMLRNDDELFAFFNILDACPHIKFIATSLPDAYEQLLERWGERPVNQLKESGCEIRIPLISEDTRTDDIKMWINFSLGVDSHVETIGDCIKELKNYKENIVKGLYEEYTSKRLPYLGLFLSSLQTVETFRRDTHLFLPILIFQKEIRARYELRTTEVIDITIQTINYLNGKNVIWIADLDEDENTLVDHKLTQDHFNLSSENYEDNENEFLCDDELFKDTKISTRYVYGVNEIVWEYLKKVDVNKHVLLYDFNRSRDVEKSAQLYYNAVSRASTLRRIINRLPDTDSKEAAISRLWSYVFKKCEKIEPENDNINELNQVLGKLIFLSPGIEDIDKVLGLIGTKQIIPDYSIIGQLYYVGSEKAKSIDPGEIDKRVKGIT